MEEEERKRGREDEMKNLNQTTNINVRFELKINGMTIDEFQKEIEKLSHMLDEMKQLSVFRDEEVEHSWIRRLAEFGNGKGEGTD